MTKEALKKIELELSISEFPQGWHLNPAMYEAWLMGKFIDAGIPVKGLLVFDGLKSGKLTRYDDPINFDKVKYIWTE